MGQYFHPRCACFFFLSTFWSVTLSNIEQHPLSVTLKNYKLALLVGKKKENPKMLIIFVFFKPFPREKADKSSFFRRFRHFFSFLAHVSREEKRRLIFIVFYYTLLTGG